MTAGPHDIVVAGAGPAGMAAALVLAAENWRVALCGPDAPADDRRTTALMAPALEMLDHLGLFDRIGDVAAPLKAMRIVDASNRLVRSPTVTFRASEIDEEQFGFNVPNVELNAMLAEAVARNPSIDRFTAPVTRWTLGEDAVHAELADGETLAARLAVAADGRNSAAREAAGLTVKAQALPQSALVVTFGHSREHSFMSTEFHTETGPFTQVPLPGRRSSLVWVLSPVEAEAMAALDDGGLSLLIERRMQSMLGKIVVEPGRQVYPLISATPSRFAGRRVALVGEAAHVFPPIGAQGLNLGFRDVQDLALAVETDRDDPGSEAVLDEYERRRRPDILSRSMAVGLLNRSLLSDMLPAQIARSAGLSLLGAFSPLRAFFMREGMRPGSGFRRFSQQ